MKRALSDLVHACLSTSHKVDWPMRGTGGMIWEGGYKTLWVLLHDPELRAQFESLATESGIIDPEAP